MPELDPRLLKVSIFLDGEATPHTYENLTISAIGTKYGDFISNVCEIRITNIDKEVRDKLLTDGTPYARSFPPKNTILIEAGRVSTGLFQVYLGDIISVSVTQAPNITLIMHAITGKHRKQATTTLSMPGVSRFKTIAGRVAAQLKVDLDFQADDKDVSNFSFSGSMEKMVSKLSIISNGVDAYVDDSTLVVRDRFRTSALTPKDININTGLVGIPEFADLGCRCTVLVRQDLRLGDKIRVTSDAYPAINGVYLTYRLGFNLANRDTPFYYILEGSREDLGRRTGGSLIDVSGIA
jgi:hypothetical protein